MLWMMREVVDFKFCVTEVIRKGILLLDPQLQILPPIPFWIILADCSVFSHWVVDDNSTFLYWTQDGTLVIE